MVHNSRIQLPDAVLERLFDLFFTVIGNKTNKEEFRKTFVDLLTPAERIMLAKRVAIVYLLLKKIDYYNICRVLKVSPSTVAKFSLLIEKSDGIVPTFQRTLKVEKVGLILEEIFNVLFAPGVPGINWKGAWERKIDLQKQKTYGL